MPTQVVLFVPRIELAESDARGALFDAGLRRGGPGRCTVELLRGPLGTALSLSPASARAGKHIALALAQSLQRSVDAWAIGWRHGKVDEAPVGTRVHPDARTTTLEDDWAEESLSSTLSKRGTGGTELWVSLDEWTAQRNAGLHRVGRPLHTTRAELRLAQALQGGNEDSMEGISSLGAFTVPKAFGGWPKPPPTAAPDPPQPTRPLIRRKGRVREPDA